MNIFIWPSWAWKSVTIKLLYFFKWVFDLFIDWIFENERINTIEKIYFDNNCKNYWYVICSNVPKENPKTQQLKLQLKQKYNIILEIKSSIIEVKI